MSGNNFYLTLPSDASMLNHPDNHGGCYTVDLPTTLHVNSHSWECALVEMIYNRDFPQILKEDIWIGICINDAQGGTWSNCAGETITDEEATVIYQNARSFVESVFEPLLVRVLKAAKITYTGLEVTIDANDYVTIVIASAKHTSRRPIRIEMSTSLARIMGFTRSQLKENRYLQSTINHNFTSIRTYFPVKLSRAISGLWVYTNIIQPHITGHSTSPLLRVIPLDNNSTNDATNVVQIQRPYYFNLSMDEIQSVTISIYNENGSVPIIFASPVVIKLNIRRKLQVS